MIDCTVCIQLNHKLLKIVPDIKINCLNVDKILFYNNE